MPKLGSIASNEEVWARWAYSEIVSTRVGEIYRHNDSLADSVRLALEGVPFDELPADHHGALAEAASKVRDSYAPMMLQHRKFCLTEWPKSQVNEVFVDRIFNTPQQNIPMRFRDFVIWNRHIGPNATLHRFDPRAVLDKLPAGSVPLTDEAPIVVGAEPGFMVDGYLRSLLFMRDAPASATLPVWVGISR